MMGFGFGMLGLGSIMMLAIFGLPILLIGLAVAGMAGWLGRRSFAGTPTAPAAAAPGNVRYCAQCGQGLHAEWTHCPHCGAPAVIH